MNLKNLGSMILILAFSLVSAPVLAGDSISLELKINDVQSVAFEDKTAWLKLTPSASERLVQLTGPDNQGKWLDVSLDGMQAMKIRIYTTVDSGVIEVNRPSPELRERLEGIRNTSQNE